MIHISAYKNDGWAHFTDASGHRWRIVLLARPDYAADTEPVLTLFDCNEVGNNSDWYPCVDARRVVVSGNLSGALADFFDVAYCEGAIAGRHPSYNRICEGLGLDPAFGWSPPAIWKHGGKRATNPEGWRHAD